MPTSSQSDDNSIKSPSTIRELKVVVLAGGVGGAKLADGVAQIIPPENLTIVVNTGDDFEHLGLFICPDLDTVMYNLAGIENPESGWGRREESWRTITEVGRVGGPDWFRLGDLDLALHLTRSHLLADGCTLTEVTQRFCDHFGIKARLLPMSDQPAPTMIASDEGLLPFQNWFVERNWQPAVQEVRLPEDVKTTTQVALALERTDLILIAPSNPFVSIDPILNVYPIRAMVSDLPKLVVAVSPIIAGKAVKGPAAKIMGELGMDVNSAAIAGYYGDLIDVFVFDRRDSALLEQEGSLNDLVTFQTETFMHDRQDRRNLAQQILDFSMELLDQ